VRRATAGNNKEVEEDSGLVADADKELGRENAFDPEVDSGATEESEETVSA
jgi:hypothetical protein